MTGFGSAESGGFRVEIRSLNHRFMDVFVKCPPELNRYEIRLRSIIKEKFERGKFDVYVSYANGPGLGKRLNIARAREMFNALEGLKDELSISGRISMDTLLVWKELIVEDDVSFDTEALFAAFVKAVEDVGRMRLTEGGALADEIGRRIDDIEALNNEICNVCPGLIEASTEKFLKRLRQFLSESECDDARLVHEASGLAEKADITEEVTRLTGHIVFMRKILASGGTIGRKLDFLIQELNREANTIASKTDDSGVVEKIIRMKAEIEKVREQAQNIQ
jgi:uncharacterized protein (TIGR00255 family)